MLAAGLVSRAAAAAAGKGGPITSSCSCAFGCKVCCVGSKLQAGASVGSKSMIGRWISSVSTRKEQAAPAIAEKQQRAEKSTSGLGDVDTFQNGPDVLAPADSLITWRRDGAVQLRMGESGQASHRPISVMTLFRDAVERAPNSPAYASKIDGSWRMSSHEEYYEETRRAARSFIELGLEPESSVGILGFNSPEWFKSSFGCIFAGGFSTGIYMTNSPEACRYVANHARCNIVVVDDDSQLQKILSIRNQLPHLRAIIQYRGQPNKQLEGVYSWAEFMAIGSQSIERELNVRINSQAPNKCCTLVYTSGTTGDPKGVMLSHDNLVWTASRLAEHTGHKFGTPERAVSYLPLSHVAAHVCDAVAPLSIGAPIYFAEPDALRGSLGQTIKEVRPISFLGVPRVWEKMHETIVAVGKQSGPVKRRVIAWAREAGTRANIARMSGQRIPVSSKIADRLILSKVRQAIGLDQCEICVSSAAPISRSTLDFFVSLNLPLVEVLGMTEATGPHTCGVVTNNVVGSVGIELPGTNTTIHEPNEDGIGEMLIHGRNVCMGYLDMEEKTLQAFGGPEGKYFYSGDLGRRDERGFLHVAGRIKEVIVTSGGENVSSVPIENAVKDRIPVLSNCILVGDGHNYLTILLTLKTNIDAETMTPLNTLASDVISWCRASGSSAQTVNDVIGDVSLHDAIQKAIDDVNAAAVSNAQRIRKWKILPTDFSIPGGELGPTLKLKRYVVLEKYEDLIDSMYNEQSQVLDSSVSGQTSNHSVVTSR